MKKINTSLSGLRARLQERATDTDRADALIEAAEQAAWVDFRNRQAANRNAAYLGRRPGRYAGAAYAMLRTDQDPNGMISRWLTHGPRTLLLAGPSRTGKSTAAYAITNHANELGSWVVARTAADLSAALKPSSDDPLPHSHVAGCDLLLIDDLGRERAMDWWLEQLHRIVDERCGNNRRLIVTTNTSPSEADAYDELVGRYGDPIVERLLDGGGVVIFDGPPIRQLVTEW